MHGLGIPTARALCVIGSDAPIRREEIETAAVVKSVALLCAQPTSDSHAYTLVS
jgi:uncharacterized protein YdiU (UPF0061 family)